MLVALFAIILLFASLGFSYYSLQQKANIIGGNISKAKAYWLAYALFNYLAFPVYLLFFFSPEKDGYFGLLVFVILIYLRSILQTVMMFGLLNWRPPYGIFSNFLIAIVLAFFLVSEFAGNGFDGLQQFIIPLFLIKLTAILLCDSYYAFVFHKIVGESTTGEQAIWFAAAGDDRFIFVNRLTFWLNIFFSIFTANFIAFILIAYG